MPRVFEHHFHWHWPQDMFDHSRNLRLLFGVRFLRDLINRLATFFIPMYLYQLVVEGRLLGQLTGSELHRALLAIGLYFGLCRLVVLVGSIPIGQLITRWGHTKALVIGHSLFGAHLLLLAVSQWQPWLVFVATVIEGVQICFFWPSYFTIIANTATKQNMGKDVGALFFLMRLAALVSPALGGAMIVVFGFDATFLVAVCLVMITIIVTLLMDPQPATDRVSWTECRSWLTEKSYDRLAVSFFGRYVNDAVLTLWPLYVFVLVGSIEGVGYLYSLSLFISMVLAFVFGRITEIRDKKPFYVSGVILTALWILRTQLLNIWHIVLLNIADRLTSDFHWLFYDTAFLRRSQGSQAYSFFVYREVVMSTTAALFWGSVVALSTLVNIGWTQLFMMGAVGVALSSIISENYQGTHGR